MLPLLQDSLGRASLNDYGLVYILIFIPIVMLRWTFPHAFGDSRIGPLRNVRLDVDHVDLMPPIISKIKPVAKGVIDF
jgi:hypothetical protein